MENNLESNVKICLVIIQTQKYGAKILITCQGKYGQSPISQWTVSKYNISIFFTKSTGSWETRFPVYGSLEITTLKYSL